MNSTSIKIFLNEVGGKNVSETFEVKSDDFKILSVY